MMTRQSKFIEKWRKFHLLVGILQNLCRCLRPFSFLSTIEYWRKAEFLPLFLMKTPPQVPPPTKNKQEICQQRSSIPKPHFPQISKSIGLIEETVRACAFLSSFAGVYRYLRQNTFLELLSFVFNFFMCVICHQTPDERFQKMNVCSLGVHFVSTDRGGTS